MEELTYLELEDGTKIQIFPTQQCVTVGETILKFEEVKRIYKETKKYIQGKRTGRVPRKMPKGFKILSEKGLSYNELCRVYNCSKTAVARWKREIKSNEK